MTIAAPSSDLVGTGTRRSGFSLVALCLAGFLFGQVVAVGSGAVALAISGSHLTTSMISKMDQPPWWWIASSLCGLWLGWGLTVIFAQARFSMINTSRAFRFRNRDLGFVLLGPALQIFIGIWYYAFGVRDLGKPTHHLIGDAGGGSLALMCLLTVVVAPAVEEIFFRGTLLIGLRDLVGSSSVAITAVAAISLDGLLFALAHGELVQLPGLAVTGAVLAYVYWRTGRLWSSFLVHASFNALGLLIALNVHLH